MSTSSDTKPDDASSGKRGASLSPGSLRLEDETEGSNIRNRTDEADASPLSSPLSSAPPSSPSPAVGRGKGHTNSVHSQPGKPALKRFKTNSLPSRAPSRSVQFLDSSESGSEGEPQTRVAELEDNDDEFDFSSESDLGHPSDGEYTEERTKRKAAALEPSPFKRTATTWSATSVVKKRVVVADPHNAICLLTNAPEPTSARQFCHIVARRTQHAVLTVLEWWWGMKYWTLFIDTRFNIVALMSDWHLAMDSNDWVLVPKYDLIQQVREWTEKVVACDSPDYNFEKTKREPISQSYTKKGQTQFKYFILPLSKSMKRVAIHRYPQEDSDEDFDPTAVVPHFYPFATIGSLISHVQPHFVIYSAGQKLATMTEGMSRSEVEDFLQGLSAAAFFGREKDDPIPATYDLTDLRSIYIRWSTTAGVPQRGGGYKWRKHRDAPSEKQEEAAEKAKGKKQKGKAKGKGKGGGKEEAKEAGKGKEKEGDSE
ncbi:hypothetical protein K438DRAFT_1759563 [Mycena galopus ATCC 62051]|nr:hypothetical protein K438DRAFT_1759563 [Mycena galopus ATCC 62051]